MPTRKRLLILGSTGSIGTQALDVCAASSELELVGLSAERSWETLVEQARALGVDRVALADEHAAARASEAWTDGQVLGGAEGLVRLVVESGADLVLNALVGSAGLGPTVATLGEGIDLALANKESLVVGGELITALAEATGARIVPVDSEHTALHQLLSGQPPGAVQRLTITASGGPFRGRAREDLQDVTVEQALAHPTWAMGGKITIDSATLMNKGLELIEAHHLFALRPDELDIVVHPQSVVHGLVEFRDGSVIAQLGSPDMRIPISHCLAWPARMSTPAPRLDLVKVGTLTFEEPDPVRFPALALARRALETGAGAPTVLNAANEIAVREFVERRLGFAGIPALVEATLDAAQRRGEMGEPHSIEEALEIDHNARRLATERLPQIASLPS
jgi:1-deoxy-D-xylulose-5-phosphate reductoisomerase